jgi:hypothetical protein
VVKISIVRTHFEGRFELTSEYRASDPLHACVYTLCLHSAVSDEYTFITNILHTKNATFHDLFRLKEEIELFLNRIPINMCQYKLNLGDHL